MKIQGTESRFVTSVEQPKVNRTFEELKANTPKQDDAVKVTISKEGIQQFRDSKLQEAKAGLSGSDKMLWDSTSYSGMISSKLPASEVMDEKGEYHHQYSSLSSQADNLLKAYAESYDEIVRGYEDGTREVWVEDKNADGGVRKLTKEEDLAALDKAYQDRVDSFTQNNDKKIIDALAANAKKIMEATGGRTKIAKEVSPELEKKQAELEKLPTDMGKKMKDAAMSFKVQYGLQQAGQIDISNILKGISIFGIK